MSFSRLAINFVFFANGFIYANWVARLPKYQSIYNMDNGTTGLVLLAMAIGALLAMPFTGWLIRKGGSGRVTFLAALGSCLLLPLTPLLGNIPLFTTLFFVLGICNGVMDVAMNAQAVLLEEQYKRPIMSSFHAVFSGGMMLGAGSAALFTKYSISLFYHLCAVTIFTLLLVLWSTQYFVKDKMMDDTATDGTFQLPAKSLIGIGIIAFCCMLGEGAIADWSTNYMLNIARSSEAVAPFALGAFSSAMMIGRLLGDAGRTQFGDKLLLIINSIVASLGLILLLALPISSVVVIACFLVGLGLSVIVPIAYSTAGTMPGISPGVGISMVTTIGYAGFLFGPPIIGFIADSYNLRMALIFVAISFGIMTILCIVQKTPRKPLI